MQKSTPKNKTVIALAVFLVLLIGAGIWKIKAKSAPKDAELQSVTEAAQKPKARNSVTIKLRARVAPPGGSNAN